MTDSLSPEFFELAQKLAPHGVASSYIDTAGREKFAPVETLRMLERGFDNPNMGTGHPLVCSPGRHHPELHGTLIEENGYHYRVDGTVENTGYHILHTDDGGRRFVICAPEYLPQPPKSWGWAVQLYAMRSHDSWGIGDFRDLGLLARLAKEEGAGSVLVSPVHACAPEKHPQNSPYSPASRQWLNLLHIAPGDAPGAERVDLTDIVRAGRKLNEERIINRGRVWELKKEALGRIFNEVKDCLPIEYRSFAQRHGRLLWRFATWCALAESQPSADWRTWPKKYSSPDNPAIKEFAAANEDRVTFYSWCQWVADIQYAAACQEGVDVVADLAVGFDANSADAWINQELLAFDFEIGAPPDSHNTEGQRWGLPPFSPPALVNVDFQPFIRMVQAGLRHAGALRIDHVMQLWRLYWIPVKGTAAQGAYVHYPVDALLAILRLEAKRSNAWIVGEDMGTVAGGVRETMESIGMLGNRSAMRTATHLFPEVAMGASSTHDQVTVAGLLTGSDDDDLRRIGKDADFEQIARTRRQLMELAHLDPENPVTQRDIHDAILARYRLLAAAPSRVVVAMLDDAAAVKERPNMPGTVDAYPNWRLALPRPIDDLLSEKLARDLVEVLGENR